MKKLQATFLLDNTSYIVTQNIVVKQYTECCRYYSCERAQRIESAAELVPQGSSRFEANKISLLATEQGVEPQ